MTRVLSIVIGMALATPALAQEATATATPAAATPTATPFPGQDEPPNTGVPPGFDDAIATPTPTPDPFANQFPPDHDDFIRGGPDDDGPPGFDDDTEWDPKKPFPGNYYALPLTLDVGWKPCLDCSGDLYSRPGEVVGWAGYAFQPLARISSPYAAAGLEYTVGAIDDRETWRGRTKLTPTARWGWNFSAASLYATTGVILPGEDRKKPGYHAGIGASSFAFMALSVCAAEAIPSVIEVGADFVDDEELGRMRGEWSLKIGWGF